MKIPSYAQLALELLLTASTPVVSQNLSYGADNFYHSDVVEVQPINFPTMFKSTIAGNLFIHDDLNSSSNLPAIIVGHPMGAVKEQSANLYATKLAEQGFITLSLDLPHWGGSSGEPRNAVSPDYYAEAFSAAVDYLSVHHTVNRSRIGAVGVCGSGSFVISAAKIDPRMRAIATVSMYDMGAVNRNGLQQSQSLEQRRQVIAQGTQQRMAEVDGAVTVYTGGTPWVLTPETNAIGREFYDFYRTPRGQFTPRTAPANSTTQPTLASNIKFMNFYPFNDIDSISPRPMLFVTGDQAHSREFSEDAFARAGEPKELLWIPGANHADLYDRVDLIPFTRLTQFFHTNL